MPRLDLIARHPLGVFTGHEEDGSASLIPDPARLHAALLNAAAQGTTAVLHDGNLEPSPAAVKALTWLENNPPERIQLPRLRKLSKVQGRFIHRNVSSINVKHRTEPRAVSDGTAVSGSFGWGWDDVPEDIAATITDLAADIACLGEGTSFVVVETGKIQPSLTLDPSGSAFSRGKKIRVAAAGRTKQLQEQFAAANPRKKPTVASDKYKNGEEPSPSPLAKGVNARVAQLRYKEPRSEPAPTPWSEVLLLEVSGKAIPEHQWVAMSVALHKALISALGFGASTLITGKSMDKRQMPVNRLAIQYLPPGRARELGLRGGALALLIPRVAASEDLAQLAKGLASVSQIWNREIGRRSVYFNGQVRKANEFWNPPPPGTVRFWEPSPAIIPETRPIGKNAQGRTWTLADSGLLSLAFVWRDQLDLAGRGTEKYWSLRDQVTAHGARVLSTRTLPVKAADYVHRVPKNMTVQPWTGLFYLGDLANDRTIVAAGQSRHLGGGLLTPRDIPEKYAAGLLESDLLDTEGEPR